VTALRAGTNVDWIQIRITIRPALPQRLGLTPSVPVRCPPPDGRLPDMPLDVCASRRFITSLTAAEHFGGTCGYAPWLSAIALEPNRHQI